jgi:hypothetical protein
VGTVCTITPTITEPGSPSASFEVTSGTLPSWAGIDADTGVLTGTPEAGDVATTSGLVVTAANSAGNVVSDAFSIAVSDAAPTAISYSVGTVQGSPLLCSAAPVAPCSASPSGGTGSNVTWSISPAIGAGLSFNTSTGVISGNMTGAPDSGVEYTVTASNSADSRTAIIYIRRAAVVDFGTQLYSLFTQPLTQGTAKSNAVACIFCHTSDFGNTTGKNGYASSFKTDDSDGSTGTVNESPTNVGSSGMTDMPTTLAASFSIGDSFDSATYDASKKSAVCSSVAAGVTAGKALLDRLSRADAASGRMPRNDYTKVVTSTRKNPVQFTSDQVQLVSDWIAQGKLCN